MKPAIHAAAGSVAMLCILSFWTSTAVAELFLAPDAVVAVKQAVLHGMWLLIPAMAIVGSSGFSLARSRAGRLLEAKRKRMQIIAGNGLLILVPAAFFLSRKATAGEFDATFYTVQAVELAVGLVQLTLMALNFRDGLKLAGRLRHAHA